ncbi:MAG: beta-ketoacyl-ACP synthase [Myxococcales bacterium]|nr:beta-ketoacyl-ACP synthase [Myxococcales bacterium]
MSRRVVVTGMAGLSPIGVEWKEVRDALRSGRSGVCRIDDWDEVDGLRTRLGAPVPDFAPPADYPRKKTRAMGRVASLSTRAMELALRDAGLLDHPVIGSGRTGVSHGSSSGSPPALGVYARQLFAGQTVRGIGANDYLQLMSHTTAANIANFFGVRGRIIPTSSACTSGSQGIGYGFDSIRYGQQDVMLTGGAEELARMSAVIFDVLYAASTRNDEPHRTPRPFDVARDGTVVGEGAGCLVLEEFERARERGAHIYAEIVGYGTNCDGRHMTNPDPEGMEQVMRQGLADAGIDAGAVDYVNAHGTATETGDIAESRATLAVFGRETPVSSLKGHLGHTLGACGALEAWMTIEMINEGWVAPTLNLSEVDERCAALDYVRDVPRDLDVEIAMSNNFAFGGVNTSLVFKRWTS